MKKMTCEICGSTDLVKQDGVFVCQSCGCKYSVEEAKKMMIEGTVKIDSSDELKNLYALARRAKESEDYENAAKYYEQILPKDSSSWEANLYSAFCLAMSKEDEATGSDTSTEKIQNLEETLEKAIKPTFMIVSNNVSDEEEKKEAVKQTKKCVDTITNLLESAAEIHRILGDKSNELVYALSYSSDKLCIECLKEVFCNQLCDCFANDSNLFSPLCVDYLKERLAGEHYGSIDPDTIEKYASEIRKYDPEYVVPQQQLEQSTPHQTPQKSSGGCYVATAVYGSYDCPQVWTLRRYRDYTLAETWYGRAFIHVYYAISPTIVKWFGNTEWFKKMWRGTLDHMVEDLNAKGVENTPYADRKW